MAYVQPTSTVILLTATGLSPDYRHTYRFKSQAEQTAFFKTFIFQEFDALTYQRVNSNTIMLERNATNVYSCDYLMFNNIRGGADPGSERWYYAFITNVEYVNEHCCYVSYMIDDLQTWFYRVFLTDDDYPAPPPMYIIRQHTSDVLYSNTQPDDVDLGGETLYDDYNGWSNLAVKPTFNNVNNSTGHYSGIYGGWLPTIAIPYGDQAQISNRSGVPSPIRIKPFKYARNEGGGNDGDALYNFIESLDGTEQLTIVDMFMYPEELLNTPDTQDKIPDRPGYNGKVITEECSKPGKVANANPWHDNDWIPTNNKMYTYPYCYLLVTNGCGQSMTYRYEYFNRTRDSAIFDISGTCMPDPEFYCVPRDYASLDDGDAMSMVTLAGVPKIPWITDQYKAYLAQTESSRKVENAGMAVKGAQALIGGLMGGVGGVLLGLSGLGQQAQQAAGALGGEAGQLASAGIGMSANNGTNLINTGFDIASTLAARQDRRNLADSVNSASTPNATYLHGTYGFKAYKAHIPVEYAKRIDDKWTKYGYPINQWGKPNIFSRPRWNYLQACSMCFDTKIPAMARQNIAGILSRGITFWDKDAKLGWYQGDNSA